MEGSCDEVLFLVLDVQHLPLDGVGSDELVNEDRLGLAESVDPVEALPGEREISEYRGER